MVLNISHKECDQNYSLNKTINYLIVVATLKLFNIEWWVETDRQTHKKNQYIRTLNVQNVFILFVELLPWSDQHSSSKIKVNFSNIQIIHLFRWW